VELRCDVTGKMYAPEEMDWYRGEHRLLSDTDKGLTIRKQLSVQKKYFGINLTINTVTVKHEGIYVCGNSTTQFASTEVEVLNGKEKY